MEAQQPSASNVPGEPVISILGTGIGVFRVERPCCRRSSQRNIEAAGRQDGRREAPRPLVRLGKSASAI